MKLGRLIGGMLLLSFLVSSQLTYKKSNPVEAPTFMVIEFPKFTSEAPKISNESYRYVFERFNHYNKNLDSSTVSVFLTVTSHYSLDTNTMLFDKLVAQLCLESRAAHRLPNGSIHASGTGAMGIGQITPTTAFGYMKSHITQEEREIMYSLGATSFDWCDEHEFKRNNGRKWVDTKTTRPIVKEWLSNETNNLIMWGYMMRYAIDKRKNLDQALVKYNAGTGGLNKWIKAGNSVSSHFYVVKINSIVRKFKELF